jgi:hypothetical protein
MSYIHLNEDSIIITDGNRITFFNFDINEKLVSSDDFQSEEK